MKCRASHAAPIYVDWVVKARLNSLEVLHFVMLLYFLADDHRNTHLLLFAKNLIGIVYSSLGKEDFCVQVSGDTFAYAASVVNDIRVDMEQENYGAILIYF